MLTRAKRKRFEAFVNASHCGTDGSVDSSAVAVPGPPACLEALVRREHPGFGPIYGSWKWMQQRKSILRNILRDEWIPFPLVQIFLEYADSPWTDDANNVPLIWLSGSCMYMHPTERVILIVRKKCVYTYHILTDQLTMTRLNISGRDEIDHILRHPSDVDKFAVLLDRRRLSVYGVTQAITPLRVSVPDMVSGLCMWNTSQLSVMYRTSSQIIECTFNTIGYTLNTRLTWARRMDKVIVDPHDTNRVFISDSKGVWRHGLNIPIHTAICVFVPPTDLHHPYAESYFQVPCPIMQLLQSGLLLLVYTYDFAPSIWYLIHPDTHQYETRASPIGNKGGIAGLALDEDDPCIYCLYEHSMFHRYPIQRSFLSLTPPVSLSSE